jgi:hypothetical protein
MGVFSKKSVARRVAGFGVTANALAVGFNVALQVVQ